jgi:hypothetical protein
MTQLPKQEMKPATQYIGRRVDSQAAQPQLVYFIQAQGGQIKIGLAVKPLSRMADLQIANPEKLTLLLSIDGGRDLEKRLHAEFRHLWIHGEWFKPGDDLLARIKDLTPPPSPVAERFSHISDPEYWKAFDELNGLSGLSA